MWQWREVRSVLTAWAAGPLKPRWSAPGLGKPSAEVSAGVRLGWRWWPIYHPHHRGSQSQALVLATDLVVLWQMWATLSSKADALFQKVLQPSYRNVLQVWSGKVRGAQCRQRAIGPTWFFWEGYPFPQTIRHPLWGISSHGAWISSKNRAFPSHLVCLVRYWKDWIARKWRQAKKAPACLPVSHGQLREFLSEFFFHAGPGSTHALPLLEKVKMKFNIL